MSAYTKRITGLAAIAAVLLFNAPVLATGEYVGSEPEGQAQNSSVPIYSGGIGDDEIAYIHSVQNQYNTKLLFTEANGEFLSDLPVNIRSSKGESVVSTVTNGPVLLVNLPEGSYTVSASENGVSKEEKLTVSGHKLKTIQFRFPGHDLNSQGY